MKRSAGQATPTFLGEWVAEPLAEHGVEETLLALGVVGVLDQLHLVHAFQQHAWQLALQLRVENHLSNTPVKFATNLET